MLARKEFLVNDQLSKLQLEMRAELGQDEQHANLANVAVQKANKAYKASESQIKLLIEKWKEKEESRRHIIQISEQLRVFDKERAKRLHTLEVLGLLRELNQRDEAVIEEHLVKLRDYELPLVELLKAATVIKQAKLITDKMDVPRYSSAAFHISKIYSGLLEHAETQFLRNLDHNTEKAQHWLRVGEALDQYAKFQKLYLEQVASELSKKLSQGIGQKNSYDSYKVAVQETINNQLSPDGSISTLFARSKEIVTKELVSIILKDKYGGKVEDDLNTGFTDLYLKRLVQAYQHTKMLVQSLKINEHCQQRMDIISLLDGVMEGLFGKRREGYLDQESTYLAQEIQRFNQKIYNSLDNLLEVKQPYQRCIQLTQILQSYEPNRISVRFSECVGRLLAIINPSDLQQAIFSLGYLYLSKFDELLSAIVKQLKTMSEQGDRWDPKPHPSYFSSIGCLRELVQSFSQDLSLVLVHLKKEKSLFLNFQNKRAQVINKLESTIKELNQSILEQIIEKIRDILRSQKSADFLIKKIVGSTFGTTSTCKNLIEFLSPFVGTLNNLPSQGMSKKRLAFHLGSRLVRLLQEHFMKYSYSLLGGHQLGEDFRLYSQLIQEIGDPESSERYSDVKLLFTLVIMETQGLKAYIDEYLVKKFEKELIQQLLHKRTDFKSAALQKIVALIPK